MRKVVLNGCFFKEKQRRGVDRFAYELIIRLDKYAKNKDIELLVPNKDIELPFLENIKIIKYGNGFFSKFWHLSSYQWYLLKNKALGVSFFTAYAPFINPGIVALHDIDYEREKNKRFTFRKYLTNRHMLIVNKLMIKVAKHILTVSNFSKNEIVRYYKYNLDKISVIYNGWEHLKKIKINKKVLIRKYETFIKNDFYFYLGGIEARKNIKWIYEMAKRNPQENFVIAGPFNKNISGESVPINIIFLGYITDEEMAFFFSKCKAFLFPSIYEGFGIPPLEALFFGAKVLCSNSSCLPEIYEDSVVYFNPNEYNLNLNDLLNKNVNNSVNILKKCSWDKSARELFNIIEQIR